MTPTGYFALVLAILSGVLIFDVLLEAFVRWGRRERERDRERMRIAASRAAQRRNTAPRWHR